MYAFFVFCGIMTKRGEIFVMVFWLVQILGIVTVLFTIFSFFQKEKWKMMLFMSATNVIMVATYILCGELLGGILVVGALVRTLVYFFYSKHNKRPEPIVMISFEIYCMVMSILLWDSAVDLLMIMNILVVTYTTWQNDVRILRLGYVFSSIMLITYDIMIGAYTTAISEVLMLISVVMSLIKYSKVTKSYDVVAQRFFRANEGLWGSNVEEKEYYDFVTSKIEKTPYYNFGIIKNRENIDQCILDIKKDCAKSKVKPVVYMPFDNKSYDSNTSDVYKLNMFFPVEFHDVWMKLIDGFNLNNTKCKIQGVEYRQIGETNLTDLSEVYLRGYLNKEDISNLTRDEKKRSKNFLNLKFNEINNGYKLSAYIAYYNGIPISMLCMLSNKIECFITKVATIPMFRRKHVASSLIQFAINKHRKVGVQDFMLCTDKNSLSEEFYKFNGFVEFCQAFALDVTDMTKYNNFLENRILY